MDNVTHALAGLLIADAVVAAHRARGHALPDGARRTIVAAGVVTAELPDIDLAWSGIGRGPETLGYMLHHRGHTHTLVMAIAAALLVWGLALAIRRDLRTTAASRATLAVALLGTLSHIVLDWTNSYGVHPFWPWDNRWYYGDAIFIVEPWLWVVAIPLVVAGERTRVTRGLLAALLVAILMAAWVTSFTTSAVAVALTAGAIASLVAAWRTRAPARALARVAIAIGAWVAVEGVFFTAGRAAEAAVRAAVPAAVDDVVLSPGVADPFCWSAIVVWEDATTYHARGAEVRPVPALRAPTGCRTRAASGLDSVRLAGTATVRWTGEWTAPAGALAALARRDCRLAAALRFMRVPAWRRVGTATELWDLRYGAGGFASLASDGRGACPAGVPPWVPPRSRQLGHMSRD
ncbi:MAG: metal-dependent hydrolase [Gemmatimonadaceae bacterium]|nr:metal-dependent hydrolase [Gemmatimonadaceae bacterium]